MKPPPRIRSAPNLMLLWLAAVLATAAGLAVLFFFDPARWGFYPPCTFHRLTGLNCPGCGGLRALHQLVHGHFATAVHFNVLAVLSVPVLLGISVCALRRRKNGAGKPQAFVPPVSIWLFLGVMVAFGILRNLRFPLLAWLSP